MKEKSYDPTLLRAVGNILAGDQKQSWRYSLYRSQAVQDAIVTVLLARDQLIKLSKMERKRG